MKIENEVGYKYTSKAGFPTSIAKTQQSIARSKLSNFYGIPNSIFDKVFVHGKVIRILFINLSFCNFYLLF